MELVDVGASSFHDVPRTGHAATWAEGGLYSFSGIPNWEHFEDESQRDIRCPRGWQYSGMQRWQPGSETWEMLSSADYPKARHGHQLIACGGTLYVIGGHNWGFSNEMPLHELAFDLKTNAFSIPSMMIPNRFAASCCEFPGLGVGSPSSPTRAAAATGRSHGRGDPPTGDDDALYVTEEPRLTTTASTVRSFHLLFGGLNENREPCNTLIAFSLPDGACWRPDVIGTAPLPQFKGGMCADPSGKRAIIFDGYTECGMQKVHLLSQVASGTLLWRAVCSSAPVVRFSLAPIFRRRVLVLVGGMQRRKEQRRVAVAHFFDTRELTWAGVSTIEGFKERTAATLTVVPSSWRGLCDGAALVSYGGCCELDATPNNRGRTLGAVQLLRAVPPSLKYLAAVALWRLAPGEEWRNATVVEQDEVLDELF